MKKIFITGISGCVGHYVFDVLKNNPDYQLYLLVRDEKKLKFNPQQFDNVTIIKDDLVNISKHANLIKNMNYVVHIAAQWGGQEGNYDYTLALFNLLDPDQCEKVLYFSTASILDQNNQAIEEAEKYGTHYIYSKAQLHKKLPELKIYPNVITLFPTWVLGGDSQHPYSHASAGIVNIRKWLWLLRFLTVDVSFHYIHSQDIAKIVGYLLANKTKEHEYVLGNDNITATNFIRQTCQFFKARVYFQIPIPLWLVKALAKISGNKLHPWDLFCFKKKYFQHKTVNAASFGLESNLQTVQQIIASLLS
ncbi:hypothetical protein A2291_07365 [candidate division WOR-1 bacterium RIFOXYB2_FULL_42_35]|uniref:NAD-dependent epimerase/dehydratase domain-containing protein n=1 Tax=candidate division WOR-1 bacterium RIFOXYC2_FULL_41_25 TaxID=1802586 RepID=A0A1F4TK94_UNCSA|nr:MAG: hypothetical protein A2247_04225 [candidate division WOR-1 bacterium RIFOXYA2_FULL_41_14]OGC22724.1 MAG: hypothetical protein A2291_07365 [candidate division WOR-1 bacterium RIFOXYB2_FULL_42_35]OGC33145.1 MAG: hypothetical protein A2462_06260 [candidate division WOR-1 bacterium RIFOXYC2_FULL_41_25]OGC44215.1 MAG: hypothetical protein A2548_06990 [candidate division WOR-1 bacterium RIFOXYD2_FULL_41_8]